MIQKVKITSMNLLAQLMQPTLDAGKSVKFTVVGNSMYPVFRNGVDTVTLAKTDKVKKYDVIFYRRDNGEYVLHRIVGKGKDGWKLCGDNQLLVEYPVKDENIIGVVTEFCRKEKTTSVSELWYIAYSCIWTNLIPLRPAMFKVAKFVKNLFTLHKNL